MSPSVLRAGLAWWLQAPASGARGHLGSTTRRGHALGPRPASSARPLLPAPNQAAHRRRSPCPLA